MMATLWTIVGRPPRSRVPIHRIVTALSTACQPGNKRSTRSTFLESHLLHRNVSISQNGRRVAPHISAGRTSARLSVCGASGGRITASTYDATQHVRLHVTVSSLVRSKLILVWKLIAGTVLSARCLSCAVPRALNERLKRLS